MSSKPERTKLTQNAATNFALVYVNYSLLPYDFNHAAKAAAHLRNRRHFSNERGDAMKRFSFVAAIVSLFLPAALLAQSQKTKDVERIRGANQQLAAAIGARDINAMDKVWAHKSYASFIGPLSTMVVVGWDGVREAWQMRFGQFDRVTISMDDLHIHINGHAAWAVGMEKVELLRKDNKIISFDDFVTNVFENQRGQWLLVAHQATPVFRTSE
jgi:ketosteroid isomerase-like protein